MHGAAAWTSRAAAIVSFRRPRLSWRSVVARADGIGKEEREMSRSNTAPTVDYGTEEAAMQAYLAEGERRAYAIGNRGPIRFAADGKLHPDILEAYWRCGFYVFEGVLGPAELA